MIEGVEDVAKRLWTEVERINTRIRDWEDRMRESDACVRVTVKCGEHDITWACWNDAWRLMIGTEPLLNSAAFIRIEVWEYLDAIEIAIMEKMDETAKRLKAKLDALDREDDL